jgi:acetoacetyl-CoA reductase
MATTPTAIEQRAREDGDLSRGMAVVTGGARGIGAAITPHLASRGATVAVGFSSNRERAEAFLESVTASGWNVSRHQGPLGDPEDCTRVVYEVIRKCGPLDILVDNAGVTEDRPIAKMTVDDWHKVLPRTCRGRSTWSSRSWTI